jgi:hypothetical protein
VVYIHNIIACILEKEWNYDTCYMYEPLRHYAKWSNTDSKEHIFYDSTYVSCPELLIHQNTKLPMVGKGGMCNYF